MLEVVDMFCLVVRIRFVGWVCRDLSSFPDNLCQCGVVCCVKSEQ